MTMDQAAGLREWASQGGRQVSGCPQHVAETLLALARQSGPRPRPAPAATPAPRVARDGGPVLMVIGLPGSQLHRVRRLLTHWHAAGRRWVGRPEAWQLVPVAPGGAHLPLLMEQQSHWALWVEADAEAFRRAWRLLLALAEGPCPRRMLVVHPPEISRQGLLENLQQAAARYLKIELVVLA